MDAIFHEKQEGSLCAQHCLNALLQGPYFTPVDLGTLAQQMDDEERMRMAENGIESEEYRTFLAQPSGNMDDSGYFSVQVISSALRVWGLELVPYTSTEERAQEAVNCPSSMKAFICHYRDHWFTIRKLGNQWFNLNSLLSAPELISDTYLAMFLAQLQNEGYCIFVVFGQLPDCEADQLLSLTPAIPVPRSVASPKHNSNSISKVEQDEDEDIQAALALSWSELDETNAKKRKEIGYDDDVDLQKALQMSLCHTPEKVAPQTVSSNDDSDEEAQFRKAIAMSLEGTSTSSSSSSQCVDPGEVRQRRLAFLNQISSPKTTDS